VKYWQILLPILAALAASFVLADDFKTINGKEYKNAKVSRVEPDGVVLITKSGISKVYFTELPKEVRERFHYDAAAFQKREESRQRQAEQKKSYYGESAARRAACSVRRIVARSDSGNTANAKSIG
jgi:hypothetical protein